MGLADVVLFGIVPGALIFLAQIVWIPFWAAGVINGIGHIWGYRNWSTADASTNIVPWGILIGGEELHNNHHAFTTSAKLSNKWYEFDIGWMYIRDARNAGAREGQPRRAGAALCRAQAGPESADAAGGDDPSISKSWRRTPNRSSAPLPRSDDMLRRVAPQRRGRAQASRNGCTTMTGRCAPTNAMKLVAVLSKSPALQTVYAMRRELVALWERSMVSSGELVGRLQDWCRRAEASGIPPLVEFSRRLRSYV